MGCVFTLKHSFNLNFRENMNPPDAPFYLRKRYYVVIMLFFGYIEMCLVQISLNVCIVDLTSDKTVIVGNTTYTQVSR